MYDIEKRSAVLENAAGFLRRDTHIYGLVTKLNGSIGVCLYIKFAFPRMLYESECHQEDVDEGALARELIVLEGRSNVPRQQVIGL